jgi:hypothetical protein
MSLGGPVLDAVEKAAIDYAIANRALLLSHQPVIMATRGMGYPGAYEPVISVAASGWTGEWTIGGAWWYASNVAEPTNPDRFLYHRFLQSCQLPGQDLDVAAPGSWVVGPVPDQPRSDSHTITWAALLWRAPHVAGYRAALMTQKRNQALTAFQAENILVKQCNLPGRRAVAISYSAIRVYQSKCMLG